MAGTGPAVLAMLGTGLIDPGTPVVRIDDAGLTRGDGCFEGCRLRLGPDGVAVVDKLDAHLARLTRSAAALGIPFAEPAWRELIAAAVSAWTVPGEAAVKLLLTRGAPGGSPAGFVAIGPIPTDYARLRRDGLTVVSLPRGYGSAAFAEAPWLLGGVKSLSYAINMAAQREAGRRGADDALFVSADGVVLESPTGSVIWSTGRTLHTTPTDGTGILAGTTQRVLFERAPAVGWAVVETLAGLDDLHAADVVWLIGSVRGPVDVVELDGVKRSRVPEVDAEIRGLCGF